MQLGSGFKQNEYLKNYGIVWLIGLLYLFINPALLSADDGFFYLQIAHNFTTKGSLSFFDLTTTNGFHPLWQLICIFLSYLSFGSKLVLLYLAFTFQFGLYLWLTKLLIGKGVNTLAIALLSLVYIGTGTLFLTESIISLFLLVSLWANSDKSSLKSAFIMSLLIVTRLDLILILPFYLFIYRKEFNLQSIIKFICISLLPILIFVLFNKIHFDSFATISAEIKSNFPNLVFNLPNNWGNVAIALNILLFSYLYILYRNEVSTYKFEWLLFALGIAKWIVYFLFQEGTAQWYFTSDYILLALLLNRLRFHLIWLGRIAQVGILILFIYRVYSIDSTLQLIKKHPVEKFAKELEMSIGEQSRVIVYDSPGRLAYYTKLEVIPTDGLVASKNFYKEIEKIGFKEFCKQNSISFILLPYSNMTDFHYKRLSLEISKKEKNLLVDIYNPLNLKSLSGELLLPIIWIKDSPLKKWQQNYNKVSLGKI